MKIIPVFGIFNFEKDIADFLHNAVTGLMQFGVDAYNTFSERALHFLSMTPFEVAGKAEHPKTYELFQNISNGFIDYGTSLVAFFFLLGLYVELRESKFEVKLESILFDVLKMMLAIYFVRNSFSIIENFAMKIQTMTSAVIGTDAGSVQLELVKKFETNLEDVGAGSSLALLLFSIVFAGVVIASGVALIMAALKRSFKAICIIPWGSLVFSTFAGNHQVNQSAISFIKWTIGTLLEASTMIMALKIVTSLFNQGDWFIILDGAQFKQLDGFNYCSFWMLEKGLLILTLCTTVSGASDLTHKALAL